MERTGRMFLPTEFPGNAARISGNHLSCVTSHFVEEPFSLSATRRIRPRPPVTIWLIMDSTNGYLWNRQSGPTNSGDFYSLSLAAFGNGNYVIVGLGPS